MKTICLALFLTNVFAVVVVVDARDRSPDLCSEVYIRHLYENRQDGLILKLFSGQCAMESHSSKWYLLSLFRSQNMDTAHALLKELSVTELPEGISQSFFRMFYQDVMFMKSDYTSYRTQNSRPAVDENLRRRFDSVDILFSLKNMDHAYLAESRPRIEAGTDSLFSDVRQLYNRYLEEAVNQRASLLKSPFLAAALSAVVPGSGRFTYGRTGDAINAFILTAGSSWLAYQHRNQLPANVILGSIALTFYISDIYGSYIGARNHSLAWQRQISQQAHELYYLYPPRY